MQIDKGSEVVVAAFRNSQNLTMIIGSVIAKSGCWSMIKGGVTPDQTMQANLYNPDQTMQANLYFEVFYYLLLSRFTRLSLLCFIFVAK